MDPAQGLPNFRPIAAPPPWVTLLAFAPKAMVVLIAWFALWSVYHSYRARGRRMKTSLLTIGAGVAAIAFLGPVGVPTRFDAAALLLSWVLLVFAAIRCVTRLRRERRWFLLIPPLAALVVSIAMLVPQRVSVDNGRGPLGTREITTMTTATAVLLAIAGVNVNRAYWTLQTY